MSTVNTSNRQIFILIAYGFDYLLREAIALLNG